MDNKKSTDIMTPSADEQATVSAIPAQRGKVRDIMTPAPVGVYYSQTIGEAARIMRDTQVGAVLVVNDGVPPCPVAGFAGTSTHAPVRPPACHAYANTERQMP